MNWPAFAKTLLLDDGRISEREAELLRRAILADGVVDRQEAAFLMDLKRSAQSVHEEFDRFLFDVLEKIILADGVISDQETKWLKELLFADRQISPAEAAFVRQLRSRAKSVSTSFESLYQDCTQLNDSHMMR
jgi:uncharacterized tellurite resistance protein B-like protein